MQRRKASKQVILVVSGALTLTALSGCGRNDDWAPALEYQGLTSNDTVTNNTYHPSHGYYHAYAHTYYPYAWGYHDPGRGYFYDGTWQSTPRANPPELTASTPQRVAKVSPAHSSSGSGVRRGGFGSFGHSSIS